MMSLWFLFQLLKSWIRIFSCVEVYIMSFLTYEAGFVFPITLCFFVTCDFKTYFTYSMLFSLTHFEVHVVFHCPAEGGSVSTCFTKNTVRLISSTLPTAFFLSLSFSSTEVPNRLAVSLGFVLLSLPGFSFGLPLF